MSISLLPILILLIVLSVIVLIYSHSGTKLCIIGLQITLVGIFIALYDGQLISAAIILIIIGFIWSFTGLFKQNS